MNKEEYELKATRMEKAVLDCYMSTRQPDNVMQGGVLVADYRTTQDIQDDLRQILTITDEVIVDYLLRAGYQLMQNEDGTPIWRIFRLR